MEEQLPIPLLELLQLELYLGSLTFILGALYQLIVVIKTDNKFALKHITLLVVTRLLTIILAWTVWIFWFVKIDIMLGPILLPALISEIICSPLLLKLFGYNYIWTRKVASA